MGEGRISVSPPSLAQDPNLNAIRERASEPGSKYAFLVHSTDSLKNGEDPSIDNKPLARQKRRRTSPEDQAILEAAFQLCPKPDKAARMALVDRVALGEKEVQIWFQNRRQSTRRKQRPLDEKEATSMSFGTSYSSPYSGPSTTQQHEGRHVSEAGLGAGKMDASQSPNPAIADKENTRPGLDSSLPASNANASMSFSEVLSSQAPPSSQESNSGRWLSNRRSAAPFRSFHEPLEQSHSSTVDPKSQPSSQEAAPAKDAPTTRQPRSGGLKKSASTIRLSFGADGTAIVRNGDSPSPPRKTLPPPSTPGEPIASSQLRRSYSSASLHTQNEPASQETSTPRPFSASQGHSASQSGSLRRVSSFRSHDSRTWEFFCDREARSELEERAEQEQSGSAADAIKLARSNSGRSATTNLMRSLSSNKRPSSSAYSDPTGSASKRLKTSASAHPPPAVQTSTTSTPLDVRPTTTTTQTPFKAPLQPLQQRSLSATNPRRILPPNHRTPGQNLRHKTPKLKQTPTFDFPATDSDKENWSPEREESFMLSMTTSPAVPPTTVGRRRAPISHTPLRRGVGLGLVNSTPGTVGRGFSSSAVKERGDRGRRVEVEIVDDDDIEDEEARQRGTEDEEEDDDDDEVATFMGEKKSGNASVRGGGKEALGRKRERVGSRTSESVSEEEDLDCVQGLLSLSQGAWR